MKMNKKQLQFDGLLAVLHQNSDYITAKSLSEQLNLSEKNGLSSCKGNKSKLFS